MIWSTTPGAGLYFASSLRSFAHDGSSAGYGRYSSTSRAHWAGFGTPAAASAAWISARVAVFALTFLITAVAVEVAMPPAVADAGGAVATADASDVAGSGELVGRGAEVPVVSPAQATVVATANATPTRPRGFPAARMLMLMSRPYCRSKGRLAPFSTLRIPERISVLFALVLVVIVITVTRDP